MGLCSHLERWLVVAALVWGLARASSSSLFALRPCAWILLLVPQVRLLFEVSRGLRPVQCLACSCGPVLVVGCRFVAPFVWGLVWASSSSLFALLVWVSFLGPCPHRHRQTHTQTHRDRHRHTDTDRHRHRHTETQRHKGTAPRRRRMKLDALQSGGPSGASDEVNSSCHFQRSNWVTSACSLSLWWVCCNEQPRVVGAPCKAALGNLLHQNVCQSVRPNAPQHVRQSVRQNARRRNTWKTS